MSTDGAKLAAGNLGGTVVVIDPDQMTVVATLAGGACAPPVSLTPISLDRVLVTSSCVSLLDLNSGSVSCAAIALCGSDGVELVVGSPVSRAINAVVASADGTKVAFLAPTGGGTLDLDSNTVTFTGGFVPLFINGDGNRLAGTVSADASTVTYYGSFDFQLNELSFLHDVPYIAVGTGSTANNLPGSLFNSSGSLFYQPKASSENDQTFGVDIFDAHTGRLVARVGLGPVPYVPEPLALDETGNRIFLISTSGVTVAQFFQAPLSLATVSPATATGGTQVTLRGSGFQNGATVSFGTLPIPATFVDSDTLQVTVPSALTPGPLRITVTNPSGQSYSYDAAFIAE